MVPMRNDIPAKAADLREVEQAYSRFLVLDAERERLARQYEAARVAANEAGEAYIKLRDAL